MALLESCFCCSLLVASATAGVYALVAYIVAFTIELWWILEAEVTLPAPAYLLCAGYFITFVVSALLLHGITVKRTLFLLSWLFTIIILSFPEAGLVLFMSLHYWKVKSLYGLTELIYWSCRVICNIAGLICVQSLYSTWREEKLVLRRLQDLNMSNINRNMPSNGHLKNGSSTPGYQNGGFVASTGRLNMLSSSVPTINRLQRSASSVSHLHLQSPLHFGGSLPNNNVSTHMIPLTPLNNLQYAFFGAPDSATTGSEFNASTFDGYFAASVSSNILESEKMFHPQMNLHRNHLNTSMNRTQSLMDLRDNVKSENFWFSPIPLHPLSVDYMRSSTENVTQSLDRRVLRHSGKLRKASSLSELNNIARSINVSTLHDEMNELNMQRFILQSPYGYQLYRRPRPIVQTSGSKRSLAESDDMQKIRDVAL
ncbi:hypothetical protein R5R35_005382 [Gryllus longicercus]|uniref:Uncharacterized protein n=1 Tax=Gryllus longicercus TaxID=2509291 RepID=A0AAN9V7G0_9ORTH